MKKVIWIVVTVFFVGWAFVEQTKTTPNVWVQIVGVILFFYSMMRLMQKVPSNTVLKQQRERAFEEQLELEKQQEEKEHQDVEERR